MSNFVSSKNFVLVAVLLLMTSSAVGGKVGLTPSRAAAVEKYITTKCKQKALSSKTINYKNCVGQQRNNMKPLIKAFNKYASNKGFIGGWCGTKGARQALGIETWPFYPRQIFKGEETYWKKIRKLNGWVVYALHDAWAKSIPEVPLVAIKENTIQVNKSRPSNNGFGDGVYCLGYTGKAVNNDWFGFTVEVLYFEAIYP